MDRRAVGEAARGTRQGLSARWSPKCLPKQVFPGYPSARGMTPGAIFQSQS